MSMTLNSVPSNKRIRVFVPAAFAIALVLLMAFDTKVLSLDELESEIGFRQSNLRKITFQVLKNMSRLTPSMHQHWLPTPFKVQVRQVRNMVFLLASVILYQSNLQERS